LIGDVGDPLEVLVVVQDDQRCPLRGGGDDQITYLYGAMPAATGATG